MNDELLFKIFEFSKFFQINSLSAKSEDVMKMKKNFSEDDEYELNEHNPSLELFATKIFQKKEAFNGVQMFAEIFMTEFLSNEANHIGIEELSAKNMVVDNMHLMVCHFKPIYKLKLGQTATGCHFSYPIRHDYDWIRIRLNLKKHKI